VKLALARTRSSLTSRAILAAAGLGAGLLGCGSEFSNANGGGGGGAGFEAGTGGAAGAIGSGGGAGIVEDDAQAESGVIGPGADAGCNPSIEACADCGGACAPNEICEQGACTKVCSDTQIYCGQCVEPEIDNEHCGGCDTKCTLPMECIDGKCAVPCKNSLRQPLADLWGTWWDGLERAVDTAANAETACAGGGARLPTATELYRVSATQSASVGQTLHTNYLWSRTPRDPTSVMAVRLSDASVVASALADTTKHNYRCVCPARSPTSFSGSACNGPPDGACFGLRTEGKRYNVDLADRAPLPKSAAIWECLYAHGHLADYITYAEAIRAGLPGGSMIWMHTADDALYTSDTLVQWQGTQLDWTAGAGTKVEAMTVAHPFRCAGAGYDADPNPAHPPDEFVGTSSKYKSQGMDDAPATFVLAHDACFERGGHLARSTELGELILAGLPAGKGMGLWTSDEAGFGPANQFLVMNVGWTGKLTAFPYSYTGVAANGVGWFYKSDMAHPFRCIYYPLDTAYEGPAEADCSGGCFELSVGSGPAKMWFDAKDRPAASLEGAIAACSAGGGHLTSERDLAEAVRHGLPNGSNTFIATWDIGFGASTDAGTRKMIVRWLDVDKTFTDLYPKYMTWSNLPAATPYRCVWTNELR
jgi:hypothetical protein